MRKYAASPSGPLRRRSANWLASAVSGCDLGLRLERLDLDRALALDDLLVRAALGETDAARHLVVRGVDGRERRLHLHRRIDARDERGVEDHAVTRGRRGAFVVHELVEVAQVFAQVVDGNPRHDALGHRVLVNRRVAAVVRHDRRDGDGLGLEIGDALAQDADEIRHDVNHGLFHAEEVRVQVAFAHAVANLAGEAGVELVLGDGFEHLALRIGARVFEVERHVERLRRHGDFVNLLPGHFQIRPAGTDDAHLRVDVAVAFVRTERFRDGIVERGAVRADALGAAEARFHGALVLVDGVEAAEQVAHDEPRGEAEKNTDESGGHKAGRERSLDRQFAV